MRVAIEQDLEVEGRIALATECFVNGCERLARVIRLEQIGQSHSEQLFSRAGQEFSFGWRDIENTAVMVENQHCVRYEFKKGAELFFIRFDSSIRVLEAHYV